jgi:hypothetical protein
VATRQAASSPKSERADRLEEMESGDGEFLTPRMGAAVLGAGERCSSVQHEPVVTSSSDTTLGQASHGNHRRRWSVAPARHVGVQHVNIAHGGSSSVTESIFRHRLPAASIVLIGSGYQLSRRKEQSVAKELDLAVFRRETFHEGELSGRCVDRRGERIGVPGGSQRRRSHR